MNDDGSDSFLLIGRINGSSSSRRQRRFPDEASLRRAKERWSNEGFNTWWIYGPAQPGGERPAIEDPSMSTNPKEQA